MKKGAARAIGLLNIVALGAYLAWMARYGQERLFHSQEGILFLLPVVPFFLVFVLLARGAGDV